LKPLSASFYIKSIQTLKKLAEKFKFFGSFADTILLRKINDPLKSFQTFPTKKFHLLQVVDQTKPHLIKPNKKNQSTAKKIM
jgi:hypothetical protein